MSSSALILIILGLSLIAFLTGRQRAYRQKAHSRLKALPNHYGVLTALWSGVPALILIVAWLLAGPAYMQHQIIQSLPDSIASQQQDTLELYLNSINLAIKNGTAVDDPVSQKAIAGYQQAEQQSRYLITGLVFTLCLSGIIFGLSKKLVDSHARISIEKAIKIALMLCSGVAIFTTIGIVLSVLFEAIKFFDSVSFFEFIFGTTWSPQTSIRTDQVGGSGTFGAIPLFVGTLLISAIAMFIAVPIGLMTAIYLSEYASNRFRTFAKPALELLAGIPTVVYGFFAALSVAPFIRDLGQSLGLTVASESALAAGIVMGVMIIPFVSSLSDDVINAVPQSMRDGSLGLGATHSETIKQVVIPAALPGIVGGILLAASRAIGETMIVVMAAGLAANLTANPLDAVTTVTVQIVTLLTGDQEFDSPKTLAAFALGLMLFVTTLVLNVIALHIVRRYREQYE
ncbi:MAG: phosphate ABC transporter permease subunit PstC [Gammaproteobacteria bacterium]|nr:phosphate ABC transporter permease subunit PstC [Gammaproteobacteria bacterium]MBL7000941.1 phosphate ABC transporter permease subunit PstC [Gammaproteobacteria bacterium]